MKIGILIAVILYEVITIVGVGVVLPNGKPGLLKVLREKKAEKKAVAAE